MHDRFHGIYGFKLEGRTYFTKTLIISLRKEHDHNVSLFNETDVKDSVVDSAPDEFSNTFAKFIETYDDHLSEFMKTV